MIKIYMYKDVEHKHIRKFPSFVIDAAPDKEQEMFKTLYRDMNVSNGDFIMIGPALFQKNLFHYAICV